MANYYLGKDQISFRSEKEFSKGNSFEPKVTFHIPLEVVVDQDESEFNFEYFKASDFFPILVENSNGKLSEFDPIRIRDTLIREAKISRKSSNEVTIDVLRQLMQSGSKIVTGPLIREIACNVMTKREMTEARNRYTRLGISVQGFEDLLDKEKSINYSMFRIFVDIALQHFHLTKELTLVSWLMENLPQISLNMKIEPDEIKEIMDFMMDSLSVANIKEEFKCQDQKETKTI